MIRLRQIDRIFREIVVFAAPITAVICFSFFVITSGLVRIDDVGSAPTNENWLIFGLLLTVSVVGAWFCAMTVQSLPERPTAATTLVRVPVYVFVLAITLGLGLWITNGWR